jgi:hypothetical protein
MYIVLDSEGKPLNQRFSSWSDADNFRHLMNRPDWKIRELGYSCALHKFINKK